MYLRLSLFLLTLHTIKKTVKIDQMMTTRLKRILFLFLGFSTAYIGVSYSSLDASNAPTKGEKTICAMSYNIRFDDPEDIVFNWEERKSLISQTISANTPDIIGIQEAYYNQVRWLEDELSVYKWYAIGSDDGKFRGEHCAIFYNKHKFDMIDSGTIWLDQGNTKGEKSVMTWVKLQILSSSEDMFVFNTRLTMEDKEKVVVIADLKESIASVAGKSHFILTGDFNAEPDQSSILKIMEWCKEARDNSFVNTSKLDYTFISEEGGVKVKKRFDYVFFSNDIPVNTYEVLNNSYNSIYPSDHLPVLCKLRLP